MSIASATSAAPSDDLLLDGLRQLTPDEIRILMISSTRRTDLEELAERLGAPRKAVAAMRTGIRRKLGIPPFEDVRDFVSRVPVLADMLRLEPDVPAGPWADIGDQPRRPERRSKHVLRVAIDDVQDLQARIAANVASLRSFAGAAAPAQARSFEEEAESLSWLADELAALAARARTRARRRIPA